MVSPSGLSIVKSVTDTKSGLMKNKQTKAQKTHSTPKRYTEIFPQAASSLPSSSKQEDNLQKVIKDQNTSHTYGYLFCRNKTSKEKKIKSLYELFNEMLYFGCYIEAITENML